MPSATDGLQLVLLESVWLFRVETDVWLLLLLAPLYRLTVSRHEPWLTGIMGSSQEYLLPEIISVVLEMVDCPPQVFWPTLT